MILTKNRYQVDDDDFDENVRNLWIECDELDHASYRDFKSVDDSDAAIMLIQSNNMLLVHRYKQPILFWTE